MLPGLRQGDWLLVDPDAYRSRSPRQGEVVVVPDPRRPSRLLVKRVEALEDDGRLRLTGDRPSLSTDSRTFGPVERSAVVGRAWARYWPPHRWGGVR
jgi:nickel-type superoxide dismutase maturation protease